MEKIEKKVTNLLIMNNFGDNDDNSKYKLFKFISFLLFIR